MNNVYPSKKSLKNLVEIFKKQHKDGRKCRKNKKFFKGKIGKS